VIAVDAKRAVPRSSSPGVSDPEAKRKIIGPRVRRGVHSARAGKLKVRKWLAQGHDLSGRDRSGRREGPKKAITIKSHHNVGGLPATLGLKLLGAAARAVQGRGARARACALGLPHDMVYRHPFPGPGLGVRILGEVKRESADLLRRADAIFIEELRNTVDPASGKTWYELTSQAFAVFLPVKSVGVMGDGRTYENVVALRAVQTSDFMTADWAELPYALLKKVSSRIINEVRGINRVTYDVRLEAAGDDRVGVRCVSPRSRTSTPIRWRSSVPGARRRARRDRSSRSSATWSATGPIRPRSSSGSARFRRPAPGCCAATTTRSPPHPRPSRRRSTRAGARWTHDRLDEAQRRWLAALPLLRVEPPCLLVHASADAPEAWRYVNNPLVADDSLRQACTHEGVRYVLGGHVHLQALWYQGRGSR
jgi:GMP synthase (glutamine-hydrolysing) B subunit